MKKRVTFFLLGIVFSAKTQDFLPLNHDTVPASGMEIILSARGDIQSNSLNNAFINRILLGGFVNSAVKESVMDRQKSINRIGFVLQEELEFRNYDASIFGKSDFGWLLKAGNYSMASGAYNGDILGLALYGNDSYLGENISLAGTKFNFMSFQKVGFGIVHKKSKGFVALNFVNLSNSISAQLKEGSIRHAADGDSIFIALDGKFQQNQTKNISKGLGAAIDLEFRLPFTWGKNRTSFIGIQAKNIGFVVTNASHEYYNIDTSVQYNGFELNQLTQEGGPFSSEFTLKDSLGIQAKTGNRLLILPGFIQIGKIIDAYNKSAFQSFYGIRVYPNLYYIPQIYAGAQYRWSEQIQTGISASYGGFGQFRAGIYAAFKFEHFSIGLGSEDMYGAISKNGYGNSVYASLKVNW